MVTDCHRLGTMEEALWDLAIDLRVDLRVDLRTTASRTSAEAA